MPRGTRSGCPASATAPGRPPIKRRPAISWRAGERGPFSLTLILSRWERKPPGMPLADWKILRPIPHLPSPSGGRPFPLSWRESNGENPRPKTRELSPLETRLPAAAASLPDDRFQHPSGVQNQKSKTRKEHGHPERCPGLISVGPPGRKMSAPEAHRNLAGGNAPGIGHRIVAPRRGAGSRTRFMDQGEKVRPFFDPWLFIP